MKSTANKAQLKALLLTSTVMLSTGMLSNTASAAQYYNCATPTGCAPVQAKQSTGSYTATKYPVVLAHGMSGWSRQMGFLDHFYDIPQKLMDGGTEVFATYVSGVNSSEVRGEQLLTQIKMITALTGAPKVNLVGHSQGGIDSRYVAGTAPEYVASVTAISSPAQGTKVADFLENLVNKIDFIPLENSSVGFIKKVVLDIFAASGKSTDKSVGLTEEQTLAHDGMGALATLTTANAQVFNEKFGAGVPTEYCGQPDEEHVINGIPYYSFSGAGQVTNGFDPTDYSFGITSLIFDKGEKNDGMVSSCSSRLGYVVRDDYHMNHMDAVNHILGITSWTEAKVPSIYRTHINRIRYFEDL